MNTRRSALGKQAVRAAAAVAAVGGLSVGLAAGVLAAGGTSATENAGIASSEQSSIAVEKVAPVFAKNAQGLSYGSELEANTPAQVPDLILAIATNGKQGYVRKTDLYPQLPTSPEDAAKKAASKAASLVTTIPVYAQDGVTVIGSFDITPGG